MTTIASQAEICSESASPLVGTPLNTNEAKNGPGFTCSAWPEIIGEVLASLSKARHALAEKDARIEKLERWKGLAEKVLDAVETLLESAVGVEECLNPSEYLVSDVELMALSAAYHTLLDTEMEP